MKKARFLLLLPLIALVACEPTGVTPDDKPNTDTTETKEPVEIPESFPRKHLIEHFTGEACGYCPYGMECIQEFVKNNENSIWVSHHAGYQDDEYTIAESKTLARTYGVTGAPSAILNREKQTFSESGATYTDLVLHPYYLNTLTKELENTTYASIDIKHTYDATTGELDITVSGLVADSTVTALKLTVLIKENDLVGEQADYYYTWEGWESFRHNKVVRMFVTPALGVEVPVNDQQYSVTYPIDLQAGWDADNCVIVAYLTEASGAPVIQAEQAPVVAETTGGEELLCEGIKAVEVPDTYPETTAAPTPINNTVGDIYTTNYNGVYVLQIIGQDAYSVSGYTCYPLAQFWILDSSASTYADFFQTYPINTSGADNTVLAGYRDDENFYLDGSMLYLAEANYLQQGYIAPLGQWLLADGTLTINSDGTYTATTTTFIGAECVITGTLDDGTSNSPAKKNAIAPFVNAKRIIPNDFPASAKYNLIKGYAK